MTRAVSVTAVGGVLVAAAAGGALSYGVALASPPAALIAVGALLLAGVLLAVVGLVGMAVAEGDRP